MKNSLIKYIFNIDTFSHFKSLIVSLLIIIFNILMAIKIKFIIDTNQQKTFNSIELCLIIIFLLVSIDLLSVWLIKIRSSLNKSVVVNLNNDFIEKIKKTKGEINQGYLLTSVGQDTTLIGSFSSEVWRSLIPGISCLVVFSIYLWFKYTVSTSILIIGSILPLVFLPIILQKN